MAKELDLQTKIRGSVKKDGGYSIKLSNRFTIGIPDLLIGLYPYVPCYAEVKDFETCVDKFNRQVEVTPKQALEMKRINDSYVPNVGIYTPSQKAAFVLIGVKHRGQHRLVAASSDVERLDHTYEDDRLRWVERGVGGYYDVKPLLEWAGIAKVRL